LFIFFKCMNCAVRGHFSGTLFKKQNIFFLVIFSCNLYISLIITTNFCKVLYSKNLEFQENFKTKRSTTFIKKQGDLYPHEVVISVLMDSSVNKYKISMKDFHSSLLLPFRPRRFASFHLLRPAPSSSESWTSQMK
jgi:hypothetical protein